LPEPLAELASVPNDPQFSQQWSQQNTGQNGGTAGASIKADLAWDIITTSRVTTAVIDSGIDYTHPDLYLNVWLNQGEIPSSRLANLIDIDSDGRITFRDLNDKRNQGVGKIQDLDGDGRITAADILRPMVKDNLGRDTGLGGWSDGISNDGDRYVDDLIGWNFVANSNNPMDGRGHGTHIAGTIGAMGNNNEGVAGIAWNTQILGIKVFDDSGNGAVAWIADAMDYAASKGVKVVNGSWVLAGPSETLNQAITRMQEQGVIVVVAAGNQGTDIDKAPYYPAAYTQPNLVTVAATGRNDELASFSNYGAKNVDLGAPGVEILSTNPAKSYLSRTGTSMASPQVAGVIALVWTIRPEWSYQDVIKHILATADKIPSLTGKVVSGGRLNAYAAVAGAQAAGPGGTPGAKASPAQALRVVNAVNLGGSTTSMSTIRLSFDRAINASTFTAADVTLTGPDGKAIAIAKVAPAPGYAGNVHDITFATQTLGGTYTLKVGPDITDPSGVRMAAAFTRALTLVGPAAPPPPTANTPVAALRAVNAVNLGGSTTSMSTIRLSFDRAINASTFTAADVSLTGPDGRSIAITRVAPAPGYAGNVHDISFATQSYGGTYTLKVGPEISDPAGVGMAGVYTRTFTLEGPPPPPPPAASTTVSALRVVNSVNLGGSTTSMSTIRLSFDRAINASTFTAADITLTGPDGKAIAITRVAPAPGYAGNVHDISFATQTLGGTYTLKVGPDITDPAGIGMAGQATRTHVLAGSPSPALASIEDGSAPQPGATVLVLLQPADARSNPQSPAAAMSLIGLRAMEVALPPWVSQAPAGLPAWNAFQAPAPPGQRFLNWPTFRAEDAFGKVQSNLELTSHPSAAEDLEPDEDTSVTDAIFSENIWGD
jgi:subtilisin family serine protease